MREPVDEVLEVPVGKDGIPWTPHHERRDLQATEALRDTLQRRETGVRCIYRDVGYEVTYPGPTLHPTIGRHVGLANIGSQWWVREGMGDTQKGVRCRGSPTVHGRVQSEAKCRRDGRTGRLMDRGIRQDNAGQLFLVRQRPAEADHSTPVVTYCGDRSLEVQGIAQVAKIVDPVLQAAEGAGPLGKPHVQLINSHYPPRMGRVGSGRQQSPPQIGPGWVAMNAQQRANGGQSPSDKLGTVVQNVPAPRGAGSIHCRR
ncbi:hypothetical protein PJL18_01801 [Paenarthrobacter nicotinovorans]|nr:hypothetical protein [Paenarthrobacter nicotinovorans]